MAFTALAKSILRDAEIVDKYIEDHGLPKPSIESSGPPFLRIQDSQVAAAHADLLANVHLTEHLALGPATAWTGTMNGPAGDLVTNAAIYQFEIADFVPVEGDVPFEQVAKEAGMDLRDFKIVVRYAMTNYIFQETRPNYIAHTAASRALKDNKLMRALMGMGRYELFPALSSEMESLQNFPGSQENTESGWSLANNAKLPLFAHLAKNEPARAEGIVFAMGALASMISPSITTDNYNWSQLPPDAQIVDVGGGQGFVCRDLASAFPGFRFVVQDLPSTVELGTANCPEAFRDRIKFEVHDFFTPQPIQGADVYFLRAIIHDWSDKYAVAILKALVPAMKPGSRVIIHDPHTPNPKALGWWQDRQARASNLRMKLFFNGHDREEGEWEGLFRAADPRFRVNSIKVHLRDQDSASGQEMVVVEAVWDAWGEVV